jgi:hypothetical protein
MSTPKHTPGPWHVGLRPGPMVYGPQGEQIVGINVMLDRDEVLANMKFIAAAPAMYEALQAMVEVFPAVVKMTPYGVSMDISKLHDNAKTALAQAEGRG